MLLTKNHINVQNSTHFFPHIEGLRAIAVLAVVLFHADFFIGDQVLFQAGFLGVDMFFVISGYLIIGQLSRIEGNRFRGVFIFLLKRILRILPTVFGMLIIVLPFIWIVSPPHDFLFLTEVAEQVVFFQSNIFYAVYENDYWASFRLFQPYLHTWSLSVEVQFYFLAGFTLIFLSHKRWFAGFLYFALLISIVFAIFIKADSAAKFYLIEYRIWEFLIGGVVNNIARNKLIVTALNKVAVGVLSLCALFVLLFTSSFIDYPIFNQQIAAAMITAILIVANPSKFTAAIMENKILRKIGLISFSIYIWHWPCLNIYDIIFEYYSPINQASNASKLAAILTAFLLSILSFRYIEVKFRYQPTKNNKLGIIATIAMAFAILSLGPIATIKEGNLWRLDEFKSKLLAATDATIPDNARYVNEAYNNNAREKPFVDKTKKNVLLIGDSASQDFYNVLNEGGFLSNVEVSAFRATRECFVPAWVDLASIIGNASYYDNNCVLSPKFGDEKVDTKVEQSDLIVIASEWQDYSASKIADAVKYIQDKYGPKKIVVVGLKSFHQITSLDVLLRQETDLMNWHIRTPDHVTSRNQILKNTPNIYFLDLQGLLCGVADNCPLLTEDHKPIAYDGGHLSKSGATKYAELLKGYKDFVEMWAATTE